MSASKRPLPRTRGVVHGETGPLPHTGALVSGVARSVPGQAGGVFGGDTSVVVACGAVLEGNEVEFPSVPPVSGCGTALAAFDRPLAPPRFEAQSRIRPRSLERFAEVAQEVVCQRLALGGIAKLVVCSD